MRRFLQHVLPKGLPQGSLLNGLWHPARREHAQRAPRLRYVLCSTVHQHRLQPHHRPAETVDRATDRSANHTPSDNADLPRCQQGRLVRAAAAFTPNRQADHDPYCLAATILRLLSQRAPVMHQPPRACRSPAYALSSRNLQHSPRITPPHSLIPDHPTSANTIRWAANARRPTIEPSTPCTTGGATRSSCLTA